MTRTTVTCLCAAITCCFVADATLAASPALPASLASPDNRLHVTFNLTTEGEPRYSIQLNDKTVLHESRLGIVRNDVDFTRALRLVSASPVEHVHDEYELGLEAASQPLHRKPIAGINGESTPKEIAIDLRALGASRGAVITDGEGGNLSFRQHRIQSDGQHSAKLTMRAKGGQEADRSIVMQTERRP